MGYYRTSVDAVKIKKLGAGYYIQTMNTVDSVQVQEGNSSPLNVKAVVENFRLVVLRVIKPWFVAGMVMLVVVAIVIFYQNLMHSRPEMLQLSQQVQTKQQIKVLQQKEKRINRLMAGGARAFSNADYIMPEDKSAYAYYQKVLKLQANHLAAQDGLKNIERELFDLARFSYFGKQYKQSLNYLDQLEIVNPNFSDAKSLYNSIKSDWEENAKITAWFIEAENHIKNYRFIEPSDNNVYEVYKKILAIQPDNDQAIRGMEGIKQYYLKNNISDVRINREEHDMHAIKNNPMPVQNINKNSTKNKYEYKIIAHKKLSIAQVSKKIHQFKIALQTGDKRGLKKMSLYIPGREKFVNELFYQYKKINVKISGFKLIAGKNKAQVNILLNGLVDINNRKVKPGGWSQFETTVSYNSRNRLKITW